MSDAIGPMHINERPSSELQSRVDAEVCFLMSGLVYGFFCFVNFRMIVICLVLSVGHETPKRSI